MILRPAFSEARGRAEGFALIVVLWTLVLIAFVVAHLAAAGRAEVRIAGNLVANSVAQAAADGAVYDAIFNLSNPQPEERWPIDGTAHEIVIGSSRVMVQLEDEASWINPSTASSQLMEALLRVTGSDAESARRLAAEISKWVGSAGVPQVQDAILAEYRAAGLDYGPPGEPIETLGELGRVLGMTPAVLAAIRPHLTLFGPPEPNPATTDPVVAAALALLVPQQAAGSPLLPARPPAAPDVAIVRITALASGPGSARVVRTAVVRVGASMPQGYTVLAWDNGRNPEPPAGMPQTSLTR